VSIPITDIYVPLRAEHERANDRLGLGRTNTILPIALAIAEGKHLVFLGPPGAGKSTLIKYLSLTFAAACEAGAQEVRDSTGWSYGMLHLPIPIRIANYASSLQRDPTLSIRTFLQNAFVDLFSEHESLPQLISDSITAGQALILFDGLDEVVEASTRNDISKRIEEFVASIADGNQVIVTSRIAGYKNAQIAGQIALRQFILLDMNEGEIEEFLQKWCLAHVRHRSSDADADVVLRLASEEIAEINGILRTNHGMRRLATNPLLLTMLVLIHQNGSPLPNRRLELYRRATSILLGDWQLNRQIPERHLVGENEARRFLGPLAYFIHLHEPSGRLRETRVREMLVDMISETRSLDAQSPSDETIAAADDFLRRVREHTGIFIEAALGEYGFMHLTFEEYYAGLHIIRQKKDAVATIRRHRDDPRWHEPIRLGIGRLSEDHPEDASALIREGILEESDADDAVEADQSIPRLILAALCVADSFDIDAKLALRLGNGLSLKYIRGAGSEIKSKRDEIGEALLAASNTVVGQCAAEFLLRTLSNAEEWASERWKAAEALGYLGTSSPKVISGLTRVANDEKPTSVLRERTISAIRQIERGGLSRH